MVEFREEQFSMTLILKQGEGFEWVYMQKRTDGSLQWSVHWLDRVFNMDGRYIRN